MDWDSLLAQAKDGTIGATEVGAVERALDEGLPSSAAFKAIYIIGRTRGPGRSTTVARYLRDDDPTVAAQALHILCDVWDLGEDYRLDILRLLSGVPGDDFGDAVLQAVNTGARYLHGRSTWDELDAEIFARMLSVARDEAELDTQRQWAAVALRNVLSKSDEELGRPSPGTKEFDRVIKAAQDHLDRLQASADG